MATSFSANQYDDAFTSRKLKNWEVPNLYQERPRTMKGLPTFMANDRGHVKPEFRRSKTEPWGSFVGTWDLPKRLPGNHVDVPTSRNPEAYEKLRKDWESTRTRLTGRPWGSYNNSLYKEGTRSLVMRSSNGSKVMQRPDNGTSSLPQSALPRKLSPIQRDAVDHSDERNMSGGRASLHKTRHAEDCPMHADNRIPLPKLDRPVYEEEAADGSVTLVAL